MCMFSLHRNRREGRSQPRPADAVNPSPAGHVAPRPPAQPLVDEPGRVPRTRTGAAWTAVVAAALLTILLIIFLVQNTHQTEISFLWMTTSTSLAVALLIAAVGSALLTLILGTARIAQLRRLVRKNRT